MACCLGLFAAAQSPLTTTFANNNGGSVGGMVFFDLDVTHPSGITIKQLDIHTASPAGELNVFIGSSSYVNIAASPTAWTKVATADIDAAGINNPTVVCLGTGFFLPFGRHAVGLTGPELSLRYTGGSTVPLVYSNADVTLTAGAASNTPFGGAQFSPRVWNGNVHYHVGWTTNFSCAYTQRFGFGCNEGATSWYESFPDLVDFDLAGTVASPLNLRATAIGAAGYAVVTSPPAWYVPHGTSLLDNDPNNPGTLQRYEWSEPLQLPFAFAFPGGATTVVHAAANGWIMLGATTDLVDYTLPSAMALLTQAPRVAPFWSLLEPTGNVASNPASGVYFDIDANGTAAYITWLDVADARTGAPPAGTSSINVQCVLHSNGDFEFRYGEVVPGPGVGPVVLGWSQGGTRMELPDPGGIDVSSQLPWITNGPDAFALAHDAGPARLGASVDLTVHHVDSVAPVAFLVVGNAAIPAGVSLAPLGAPGCFVFTNSLASATVSVSGATGSGVFALGIPNQTALLGATFFSQYASLTLRNALLVSTSNAVRCTIGR